MTLRIGPGSSPHLVKISTEKKAIEVKTSHVAMNAFYAGVVNLAHQVAKGAPFFEKREVVDLSQGAGTAEMFIKVKDLKKVETTVNPAFLKSIEGFKASKRPVSAAPARESIRSEDEFPKALTRTPTPPRTPTGEFTPNPRSLQNTPSREEAPSPLEFFEPVDEAEKVAPSPPLEPSPKAPHMRRVSSQPKMLSEEQLRALKEENQTILDQFASDLNEASLKNADIKTVMQALVTSDYTRSGTPSENLKRKANVERYLETAVYNPKIKKRASVRQLMSLQQVQNYLKRLQSATPKHMDYHKMHPLLQQRIFYETLNEIKTCYNININPDELKSYKTPTEALNHPGLKQLSAILERRSLYQEERELIELLLERFENTFYSFKNH
jgi:hypothetical protein